MNFELTASEAPPPPHFNVGFRNFARTTSQRHYTSTLKKGGGGFCLTNYISDLSSFCLTNSISHLSRFCLTNCISHVSCVCLTNCISHLSSFCLMNCISHLSSFCLTNCISHLSPCPRCFSELVTMGMELD